MHIKTESETVPASVSRDGIALIDGQEYPVNLDDIMVDLGVEWTVRFRQDDFLTVQEFLFSGEGKFTHFNLGGTIHRVGKCYAIVPILRPGTGSVPPLVDYAKAIKVVCTRVLKEVHYSAFDSADFTHSLPVIQSESDLKREMCNRYCAVRNLSAEEVCRTPVTLTEFEMV